MSFARAKITRFNEKPNARSDSASGIKTTGMKSQIPKINRSHSQPQPSRSKSQPKGNHDQPQKLQEPSTNLNTLTAENQISLTGNSFGSEDFKDALDGRLTANSMDTFQDLTMVSISKKESITSRSSVSGIPLPVKSSTSRVSSNKESPRSKVDVKESDSKSTCSTGKRSLELQFFTKKKRMELLKKELEQKQKPLMDLYHSLTLLKKKLEESGKVVPLENLQFLDYSDINRNRTIMEHPDISAGGEIMKYDKTLDSEYMVNLRDEMEPIPRTFSELGKCLMTKRSEMLDMMEKVKDEIINSGQLAKEFELINDETEGLQKTIDEAVDRQEKRIERILKEVGALFQKGAVVSNHLVTDLEKKVKHQEKIISDVNAELHKMQQQLKDTRESRDTTSRLHDENVSLKERLKTLESDLQTKKKKITDHGYNMKGYETKIESLSRQTSELEKTKREAEAKVNELNGHMRTLQAKLKTVEQKWKEEKEEIMKNHKGEHAILEKLTNERQALDTRVNLMNNILDEQKRSNDAEQERLKREMNSAKDELSSAKIEKQILQDKLDSMQQEVARLSMQQQQAVDVIKNTIDPEQCIEGCNFMTEREAQLKTELLATRVALKAAQERIENYTAEKMRFIDSIEKLNCDGQSNMDTIGKSLVQKEEVITRLEQDKKEAGRLIETQSMTISQLNAKIDNLQAGAVVNNLERFPHDTNDLKLMLEEGKSKLQRALTKSLENEQKLIKYEHDLNQQKKQLNDMDNLLKVRDGLIGMLKAKKDELLMENESLHRYSEEIRQLLFDTKEELKQKSDAIQELSGTLDNKGRTCFKLEKKIKDLETTLSETNEKRFKLQDTVGSMEKELQTTKAHINQIAEMQTRYAIDMPPTHKDVSDNFIQSERGHNCNCVGGESPSASPIDDAEVGLPRRKRCIYNQVNPKYDLTDSELALGDLKATGAKVEMGLAEGENDDKKTMNYGDAHSTYLREMYYYVNLPPHSMRNYTEYIRRVSPLTTNSLYKRYSHEPLTKSLIDFAQGHKMHSAKMNSLPILQKGRKHAKIQTSHQQKTSSFTQTDAEKKFLNRADVRPKYSFEDSGTTSSEFDNNKANNSKGITAKINERREFINVVNKLSEFDNRKRREQLGLGKEFSPIVFGGVTRYKVMNSGNLMWCRPSKEMKMNNMLITKDILAHSSNKIKGKNLLS